MPLISTTAQCSIVQVQYINSDVLYRVYEEGHGCGEQVVDTLAGWWAAEFYGDTGRAPLLEMHGHWIPHSQNSKLFGVSVSYGVSISSWGS